MVDSPFCKPYKCLIFIIACIFAFPKCIKAQLNITQFVDPMIGTGGHGHTFPGATVPFGMMQLSPDTRLDGWDGCSGYHYSDSVIYGFSHTHLSGTGCSDYGDILLMPMNKPQAPFKQNYASSFSHTKENASTGFYQVYLNKPKVDVQLTTTARCGMHQYTFAEGADQLIALDLQHRDEVLDSEIEILYPNKIRGYRFSKAWASNQKVYFEIEFNRSFKDVDLYNNDSLRKNPYLHSKNIKALFYFGKSKEPLIAKIAISPSGNAGAAKSLETEMPDFNFELYKNAAKQLWNKELSVLMPKQDNSLSKVEKIKFYTALYHCMIQPNVFSDANGYRGMDDKVHKTDRAQYSVFSIWDTYRAWNPLMTIIAPNRVNDFIHSFLNMYSHSGKLPIWELSANETNCMIGNHAVSIIWDAYSKGIRNYDVQKAFAACDKMASDTTRADIKSVLQYGFVRTDDDNESVSKTLELAYDDWCLAQFGHAILKTKIAQFDSLKMAMKGSQNSSTSSDDVPNNPANILMQTMLKDSIDIEILKEKILHYIARSNNWKNVYDPNTGFMRAIKNGAWYLPFSPYTVDNNYTEANSWQYSFYVPHDIAGLIKIHGGQKSFTTKLNDLFAAETKTDGREQADITGLMGQYAHGNEPSHHIAYLYNYSLEPNKRKEIIKKIMNEFYTISPDGYIGNEDCGQMSAWYVMSALGLYQIAPGAQVYEYDAQLFAQWKVPTNKCSNQDESSLFCSLHGVQPQKLLGNYSPSFIANPVMVNVNQIFKDSQLITMQCNEKDAFIFYKINQEQTKLYVAPFWVKDKCSIVFYSSKDDRKSPEQVANFYVLPSDRTVQLKSVYNKSYSGGGAEALLDGIHGDVNWRKGNWQGYQSQDFEATVTLKQAREINSASATFLQDQRSWIFYPTDVVFYYSLDGKTWIDDVHALGASKQDETNSVKTIASKPKTIKAKYIKVIAKNYGLLPAWHPGAGGDAFIFIDEITVN
jgi:putative alpha-1,2-mannosidase